MEKSTNTGAKPGNYRLPYVYILMCMCPCPGRYIPGLYVAGVLAAQAHLREGRVATVTHLVGFPLLGHQTVARCFVLYTGIFEERERISICRAGARDITTAVPYTTG